MRRAGFAVTGALVAVTGALAAGLGSPPAAPAAADGPTRSSQLLRQDVIVGADMWDRRPRMMAAGLGFTNIIGVPGLDDDDLAASERRVREVGGAWNRVSCAEGVTPPLAAYTSASSPQGVAFIYGYPTTLSAGLPVEFSWPVRPSTLSARGSDFRVTLSDGRQVTPELSALYPNFEYNERAVVVLFGKFGNRLPPQRPDAVYPVKTEVARDDTPLQLVGPRGRTVSAVGLSATASGTPYANPRAAPARRTGPRLAAAKLTRMSTRGEGGPRIFGGSTLPNDGVALYGDAAKFRLRVYTTGGFSPDGVRAVFPTEYSRYFRLRARAANGRTMRLTRTGVDYRLPGGRVRILGLADLGRRQSSYDDCYREDKDNQIDIVLDGDAAAVRRITHVEIPAAGRYDPFYNPGGPGNDPTPGVRYTAPGPAQSQPVLQALDDPMTVTFQRTGA